MLVLLLALCTCVRVSALQVDFPSDAIEGPTTEVSPGVFQTLYSLPLRPLSPGEVRVQGK
jgi:hypothetical protein